MHSNRFPEGFKGMSHDRMGIVDSESNAGGLSTTSRIDAATHRDFSDISSDEVVSPASTTDRGRAIGRVRSVTRSPVQEFELRPGRCKKIPKALEHLLMGATTTATIHRNGISFTPKLLNPQGTTKRLTWWHPESPVCQPVNFGKSVTVSYDPLDCSFIHVLDAKGRLLDTLPLKDKCAWFDREEATKAIAGAKRIASRLSGQLQHLHVADSEAAADGARSNKAKIENIVQTFPKEGHQMAPAKSSENATAIEAAHSSAKRQKSKDDAIEAEIDRRIREEGDAAAELLSEPTPQHTPETQDDTGSDGRDFIDLIL